MRRRKFIRVMAATVGFERGTAAAQREAHSITAGRQAIQRHPLGKTGVEVSILALGGVTGMQLPPSNDHDPAGVAETALNLGITYFDTAPSYNDKQSETNYGQVLARRRREVFLACETGDRSYDGTMQSIEQSLKSLRTDHFNLLQIHGVSSKDRSGVLICDQDSE